MNAHARGYDKRHQKTRRVLIARMTPGEACWWCGQPMYEKPELNWDKRPLAADHIDPHGARARTQATRLLHFTCNSQRQDGHNDHRRPALTGRPPGQSLKDQTTQSVQWQWG